MTNDNGDKCSGDHENLPEQSAYKTGYYLIAGKLYRKTSLYCSRPLSIMEVID